MVTVQTEHGFIRIASEVFTILTGIAATNCFGVKGMTVRSVTDGLVHLLKRESMGKGVYIIYNENGTISIELHIAVDQGVNIPVLCSSIIEEVRYKVASATGVVIKNVDVSQTRCILAERGGRCLTRQITGALFKAMVINGAAAIDNHKGEINELNVFPVPDGDTGTNMSLTMGAGAAALADSSPGTVGRAAEITAGALLRGARGNSGVILSLLFRGIARYLKDMDTADALDFSHAITSGVESAYKAVMKPTEGTILTVSRIAANAAVLEAEKESDIEIVLENAISAGYEALANDQSNPTKSAPTPAEKGILYSR